MTTEAPEAPAMTNGKGDPTRAAEAIAQTQPAPQAPTLAESVVAFTKAKQETNDEVVESEDFVDALFLAVASRTHVYVAGAGGVGKTFGADIMAQHFGVQTFYTQFRADTKREEVFGPLSMTALQQDLYVHVTKGYLPEAEIGLLDEFKDAGRFTRQLLNALNERRFVNGGVVTQIPLVTAVGTTNFWIEESELEALFDRFAQRLEQKPVSTSRGFKKILRAQRQRERDAALGIERKRKYTVVTPEQLTVIQHAIQVCNVDAHIDDLIDGLRKEAKKAGIEASPRRWGEGDKLARANAVLAGRDHVSEDDLRIYARVLLNHPDDEKTVKQLTAGFRDKLTAAAEEASTALDAVRELLAPQREAKAKGETIDFGKLSEANKLLSALSGKIDEAKKANGGRSNAQLDRVVADMAGESEFMRTAVGIGL
jgi:MoxR-like ATPase